tara:strand:- start:32862 stop:33047 length:186 start_codon:yes stop_codon:yes gene_type:complete
MNKAELLNIIQIYKGALEAIRKDNEGDFSDFSREMLINHILSEKRFCGQVLRKVKSILNEK